MRVIGAVTCLVLFASANLVARVLQEKQRIRRDLGTEIVYLPPEWLVRRVALGRQTVAADLFWVQALQYYGEEANRPFFYRDLYRFIDLVVALDPDFEFAYRFGGTSVPYNSGRWTWHNVAESSRILERGLERFPNRWEMWMQLGFNRGIIGTDFTGAAAAFERAAACPGAPRYLAQLVTTLYATAGATDRAKAYAAEILAHAEEPEIREVMERRLIEIEIEEQLQRIDKAIADFRAAKNKDPMLVVELVLSGHLKVPPHDPLGGDFIIVDGEARSTSLERGRLRVADLDYRQ